MALATEIRHPNSAHLVLANCERRAMETMSTLSGMLQHDTLQGVLVVRLASIVPTVSSMELAPSQQHRRPHTSW
eukprot:754672-Amphidinium_carterae.1